MNNQISKRKTLRLWSFVLGLGCCVSLLSLTLSTSSQVAFKFEIRQPSVTPKEQYLAPTLKVTAKKDKQVYDTIEPLEGGLQFPIKVRGSCGAEGSKNHLQSASVTLVSGTKRAEDSLPIDKSHRTIGADHGVGWNNYMVVFPYMHPQVDPIRECNSRLGTQTRVQRLQQGFDVTVGGAYEAELAVTCMIDELAPFKDVPRVIKDRSSFGVFVRCMPTGYVPTTGAPPRHGVHYDALIESVTLNAEPAELKGHACPVYVGFRGEIRAGENRPNDDPFTIKYRFVGDRSFSTPFYEVTMRKGESKPVFWKRRIEALSPTSAGRGNIAAPGVAPKIPIYQGYTTLEVVYPETPEKPISGKSSQKATFTVDCNPVPQRTPPPRGPRVRPNP
jgi:hypothetical protein